MDVILTPVMIPRCCAFRINRLRLSMISIDSRGERGHPCLMPLDPVKNLEGMPLTNTAKFDDITQPKIQLTPTVGIPICKMTSLRKV